MNQNRISLVFKCLIALSVIFTNYHLRAQTQNEIGISLFRADIFDESSNPYFIFQPAVKLTRYSGKLGIRGGVSFERFYDDSGSSIYPEDERFNSCYAYIGVSYNPRLGRLHPYPFIDFGSIVGNYSSISGNGHLQRGSFVEENELGIFISPGYGLQLHLYSNLIIGFEIKGIFRFSRYKQYSERYSYSQFVRKLTATDTSTMYYGSLKIITTGLTVSKAF